MGFHVTAKEFKVVRLGVEVGKLHLHAIVLTVGDARGWRAPAAIGNHDDAFLGFTDDDASIDSDVHAPGVGGRDGCLHWSFRTDYLDKPPRRPLLLGSRRRRFLPPWLVAALRYLDDDGDLSMAEKKKRRRRKLLLATTAQEAHIYDPDSDSLRKMASIAGRATTIQCDSCCTRRALSGFLAS
ncbi:hypothetical protein [Oryza sativa Japonica Group]|uniref:Os01g0166000 protein n=2 Tax=Oryza TaxID=4527 RepID=A0A0P0UYN8_ORYSJ|nr:hypothetical protein OsJ_00506 [Oryza sativa Japonica Group]BAD68297.1 hypothetical protein [Oryza sativa Japonica Group]BAS70568.1 Os01g0166000 [Oryza sativa Japonica Group]